MSQILICFDPTKKKVVIFTTKFQTINVFVLVTVVNDSCALSFSLSTTVAHKRRMNTERGEKRIIFTLPRDKLTEHHTPQEYTHRHTFWTHTHGQNIHLITSTGRNIVVKILHYTYICSLYYRIINYQQLNNRT